MNYLNKSMDIPRAAFLQEDAESAYKEWGADCGPGALAAMLNMTLDAVRPHLFDFENKGYINPKLMFKILSSLGYTWQKESYRNWLPYGWPNDGLVRVQFEGPWCDPGVPTKKRYRHTHWVASRRVGDNLFIFDINCMNVGGWVTEGLWSRKVVPWMLSVLEPGNYGTWHPTHVLEVMSPKEVESRKNRNNFWKTDFHEALDKMTESERRELYTTGRWPQRNIF
jgi:hypothetical protein